jgi:ribosomal protein S18 acetylase RimI-like enzyme
MEISLANAQDIPKLVNYFRENNESHNDFMEKRIKYFIENNLIVLAKEKEEIIGQIFVQIKEKPRLGVAEIETVGVNKHYQGKGIGTELAKKAINYTKEYFEKKEILPRCIYLLTRSDNLAAHKIYEKAGFKKSNTIGKIFKEDQPEELVMNFFF